MDCAQAGSPCPATAFEESDFEELRPELAGDEEAIVLGVVGDAVEDIGLGGAIGGSQETAAIDRADDFAGFGIDAGDAVGLPDVGVNLAFHPFELVQFDDGAAVLGDGDSAGFLECLGIPEAEVGGAIAHDDALAVSGQAPAFAGVGEFAFGGKAREVVDEALLRLPG